MQNIQDKEFDQLIKSQFEEAGVEPSSDLWGGIETKLEGKRKQTVPIYWIAAAVAVMGLSIGLLFYSTEKKHTDTTSALVHRAADKTENKITHAVILPPTIHSAGNHSAQSPVRTISESLPMDKNQKKSLLVAILNRSNSVINITVPVNNITANTLTSTDHKILSAKKDLITMHPLKQIERPDYKSIAVKQDKMELPSASEEIVLASANVPEDKDEVINENDQKGNKGIRNVGDLVNYVVGKLDKREDKAIKFQTDDDNSSLIGLNIGILKFGQRKQK